MRLAGRDDVPQAIQLDRHEAPVAGLAGWGDKVWMAMYTAWAESNARCTVARSAMSPLTISQPAAARSRTRAGARAGQLTKALLAEGFGQLPGDKARRIDNQDCAY